VIREDVDVRDEFEKHAFARFDAAVGHRRRHPGGPSHAAYAFDLGLEATEGATDFKLHQGYSLGNIELPEISWGAKKINQK
jgi:hypothetical protein